MAQNVVIESLGKHTATIVFSHGLGDTAQGWSSFATSMRYRFPYVRWILPTAPMAPVTLNGGYKMNSWFDILSLTPPVVGKPSMEDEAGMLESSRRINGIISQEIEAGIPANRIMVGGFSQGAVIALLASITSERKLAGVISLSGFLGLSSKIAAMKTDTAPSLPIFWGHGEADQTVRYIWGKQSKDLLTSIGFTKIEFHSYPGMGHSFCDQEEKDLVAWLKKTLPESPTA